MEGKHGDVLFATAGYDHTVRFWNIEEANCYHILQHPDSQINDLDISKDGKFLAAAGYRHLRVYDIQSSNTNAIINFEGHTKNVCSVGFNESNSWIYSIGEDGGLYILDHRTNNTKCQRSKQLSNTTLNCGFLHPNQVFLVCGSKEGKLYFWDLRVDELRTFIPEPVSPILSVSIDDMGQNIAVSNDQGLCSLWPMDLIVTTSSTSSTSDGAFNSTDHPTADVGVSLVTPLSCLADQGKSSTTPGPSDTSANSGAVEAAKVGENPSGATNQLFSGQGKGASSNHVTVNSPKVVPPIYLPLHKSQQYKGHTRYVLKNHLSHDSKLLLTCSDDGNALLWNVETKMILHKFLNPNKRWVWDSTFTKDGEYLLTASSDGKARLWEVATGTLKREFTGHQKAITCLALKD